MPLEINVVPALLGAGAFLLYRLALTRIPRKSAKVVSCQEDFDNGQVEEEPEPEAACEQPRRSVAWPQLVVLAAIVALLLLGGLLAVLEAPTSKSSSEVANVAAADSEFLRESLGEPASHSELALHIDNRDDVATPGADAVSKGPEVAPVDVYRVRLARQRMPIYSVGDVEYYRSAYYGTLEVGSPPVPFKVVFDTGSGHLILPSTYCHTETCKVHERYRRSLSTSGTDIDYDGTPVAAGSPRDQITVSFGTGEVTGVFVEDVVCMDAEAEQPDGQVVKRHGDSERDGCITMRFIAATDMSEDPFKSFQFDGVLGLGLPGLSQTPQFNFLEVVTQSMHEWGGAGRPHTFAVFLAEAASEDSEIAFGGWAAERLADDGLSWNTVLDPEMGHWMLSIKSMRVGNERVSFCDSGCKAVVDTGTSLFAVPTVAFPELYELLRHSAPLAGHCRGQGGPELHIELESSTVILEARDYARLERSAPASAPRFRRNAPPSNETVEGPATRPDLFCKPMLMALDLPEPLGPKLFILGEPVLRKYYTVYDGEKKSVGIGRAKHRKGARPASFLLAGSDTLPRRSIFDEFRRRRLAT